MIIYVMPLNKKVKTIYAMVGKETNDLTDFCEDKDLLKEIGMRLDEYESGNVKPLTWAEVKRKAKLLKSVKLQVIRFEP